MPKNSENNWTEAIILVTPTPGPWLISHPQPTYLAEVTKVTGVTFTRVVHVRRAARAAILTRVGQTRAGWNANIMEFIARICNYISIKHVGCNQSAMLQLHTPTSYPVII